MNWTTDKPTVAGYYWYKNAKESPRVCEVDESIDMNSFDVLSSGWSRRVKLAIIHAHEGSQWAGPLQPPGEKE